MSSPADVLRIIGPSEWDVRVYTALSNVSAIAAKIRSKANVRNMAISLHKINRELEDTLAAVYEILEGKRAVETTDEPITPQNLHETARNIYQMARVLAYVFEQSKRVGLTNNSLTAGPLKVMHARIAELDDLADWFDVASQSENLEAIFSRTHQEKERGELYDLSRVD